MTIRSELDAAWAVFMEDKPGKRSTWTQDQKWRADNPAEFQKLLAYRAGGPRPVLVTEPGRRMVAESAAWLLSAPVVEPPPSGWVVAPPVPPITTITNAPGLGINATVTADYTNYVIDGTGNTGALFQTNAHGSSLRRCQMRRVAVTNAVSYGKHAVYGKVRNLLLEDIDAECSPYCASGFSLRFDGAVLRRFKISGAPHAVTYYETSSVAGTVLVEQGSGSFTDSSAAVWMDAETDYQTIIRQAFTFRDVHFTGPASALFLRVAANRMQGSVRIEGCTINGRPVTAADVTGVPNLTIIDVAPTPPPTTGIVMAPVGPFTQRSSALFLRTAGDALTEKIEVTSSPDYGIGNMVWPPQPSTGTWTLRDCVVRNVAASPPRSMDGRGEAGFWIGQRTRASRLRASGCAWMGGWTGASCDGSVIEDFDFSGNPHVGLYVEHVTQNTTFRRFVIDHRGADASAVNVEWWYTDATYASTIPNNPMPGKAGSHDLIFEDFDITVDAGNWAFFLDAGTYGVTIRNGVIRGSGNGITHPQNLANPAKPNVIDWASIQFLATGTRELVHDRLIG